MLGQHAVEVDRESNHWLRLLHEVLPALPASSIIPKRTDDVTHSDDQQLHELLPQLELSQPPCGQDDADDAENSQNDTTVALSAPGTRRFARRPSRSREEAGMIQRVGWRDAGIEGLGTRVHAVRA